MTDPARPSLRAVADAELPVYPISRDVRLTTHYFIAFHHDRWLASRFRAIAKPAVRAFALDLWCLAQKQNPVGTLPTDDRELAFLLHLDLAEWKAVKQEDPSPLYGWERYRTEGGVRFGHRVVIEILEDAIHQRERKAEAAEADKVRQRLARLVPHLLKAGARQGMLDADPELVMRCDEWLTQRMPPKARRNPAWARRALEADAMRNGL